MNCSAPSILRTVVLSSILFVLVSGLVQAQTTWIGGTDLNWSTAANWNPATAPITGQTALLNDSGSGNRTIVYDTGASGALGTLTLTQTSGFLNELDVQKNLTIANAVTLAASGGGTAQLTVDSSSSARTVTFTGGLTVGSGGNLSLLFGANGNNTASINPIVAGNVTLNGGAITLGPPIFTTGTSFVSFNKDLTINSGTFTVNTSTSTAGERVYVAGNFSATGGSFITTNSTSGLGGIYLSGATNSFSGLTFAPNYGITLEKVGNQTLTGLPAQNTTINLNLTGQGTKTVSGTTVSVIGLGTNNGAGALVTLKMGSNLALNSGAQMIYMNSGSSGNATQLGIDANGHTLDMSLASTVVALATGTNGVWKPNLATSSSVTWALTSSAANGVIKAKGFDFTAANVTTTVGANMTLESVGAGATVIANNLGSSGGPLDVASTFKYSGSGNATLASGRSIGTLLVSSGTLTTTGPAFAAATGIEVASGAVLDFSTVALTTPSLTLDISGINAGQLKTSPGGGYVYTGGNMTLNFATTADASLYHLISFSTAPTGDFSTVTLAGVYTGNLTLSGGIWTGSSGASSFSFSQATGDLGVIPEPTTAMALLLGAAGLMVVRFLRRGRRS